MMAEIIRGIEFRKGSSTHENETSTHGNMLVPKSKQRKERRLAASSAEGFACDSDEGAQSVKTGLVFVLVVGVHVSVALGS